MSSANCDGALLLVRVSSAFTVLNSSAYSLPLSSTAERTAFENLNGEAVEAITTGVLSPVVFM